MNFTTITKDSDIGLNGITVTVERHNSSISMITFSDGTNAVRVVPNYSAVEVLIPTPPKMVDKWRVTGTVQGFEVAKDFDSEWEAKNSTDYLSGDTRTQIEKLSVSADE